MRPPCWKCYLTALLLVCVTSSTRSQEADWLTGRDLDRQLDLPVGITWSENPLRSALDNLARSHRVSIWLDRRLDPGFKVDFTCQGQPLRSTLQRLALRLGVDVSFGESVVYFGPKPMGNQFATLVALRNQEIERLPGARRAAFQHRESWNIPELATPRELLRQLCEEAKCRLTGEEQVLHDLWPARSLPSMTLVERLSLVLAGFDLTFAIADDGNELQIVSKPHLVTLRRTYAPQADISRSLDQIQELFPQVQAERAGKRIAVTARLEDHRIVARWIRGEEIERAMVGAETRYTLNVQNKSLGAVIMTVAQRSGYQLKVDPQVAAKLRELVTFQVADVDVDGLLQAALRDSGIRYRIENGQLVLTPGGP
jgi:hypothetical protein